jgi:threonine dehydrogenase-like Zn-dependent dehydrogenase
MAAENCDIKQGQTIVVFGCGPVGLFAIKSAFLLDAQRVIAIDTVLERLALAREAGAETLDYTDENLHCHRGSHASKHWGDERDENADEAVSNTASK